MPEYRVYCLDHHGESLEVQSLTASTDEEAIRQASALPGLRQCEVWRGNRLIAKVTEFQRGRRPPLGPASVHRSSRFLIDDVPSSAG